MKKVYFAALLNLIFINLNAQTFEWAAREGLWAYDYGYGIDTDNSGNVYVAGKYEMESDFSGTIVSCEGNHDIFVAKYDPAGSLVWVRTGGSPLGDYAHAVACDGSFVYAAGEVEGNFGDVVSFQGSPITFTTAGDNDIFLCKYDLSGNLLWVKNEGGSGSEKALGVAYDNSGNVYICGLFKESFDYEGTMLYNSGLQDVFVAKYDASGNFQWAKSAGGPGRDEALSIRCDAAGNIYVCGMHSDGAVFGSNTLASPLGYYDAFLAKYAPDGTLLWARSDGSDYDDVAWSLTIDNAGKIYVGGEYNAYAVFDGYAITSMGANADIYVACYDAAGVVQWLSYAGGSFLNRARGIGTDGTNTYITGQFGGSASFGSHTINAVDTSDVFVASLNSSGNFRWAMAVGGTSDSFEPLGYESGIAVHGDASGYVYATGGLLNGGVFGSTSYNAFDRTDIFVTKIAQVGVGVPESDNALFSIHPNPSNGSIRIGGNIQPGKNTDICLFNCLGQKILTKPCIDNSDLSIDLSAYERGIYFVEISSEGMLYREKIILQ